MERHVYIIRLDTLRNFLVLMDLFPSRRCIFYELVDGQYLVTTKRES